MERATTKVPSCRREARVDVEGVSDKCQKRKKDPKRLCQHRSGPHEGEPRKHQVEFEKALRVTLERQVFFL